MEMKKRKSRIYATNFFFFCVKVIYNFSNLNDILKNNFFIVQIKILLKKIKKLNNIKNVSEGYVKFVILYSDFSMFLFV